MQPTIETLRLVLTPAVPGDASRLHARSGPAAELALITGAHHGNVAEVGGEAYRQLVLDFFDRHLTEQDF